jgi:hypothetical protein
MKTTIQRPISGGIEYDDETDQVSVLRRDLAERITWMLTQTQKLTAARSRLLPGHLSSRLRGPRDHPVEIREQNP